LTGWVRQFDAGFVSFPDPETVASTLETILSAWKTGNLASSVRLGEVWKLFDARTVVAGLARYLDSLVETPVRR